MKKIYEIHGGDRAEFLAQYVLSTLGHVVPVPRQADFFGVDCHLKLGERNNEDLIMLTGLECDFQIKSSAKKFSINSPEKRLALYEYAQPYFVLIVTRDTANIQIYSTLNRFHAFWADPDRNFDLILGSNPANKNRPTNQADYTEAIDVVYSGPPIIEYNAFDFDDPKKAKKTIASCHRVLKHWIAFEKDAITWRELGMPVVPEPLSWKKNTVSRGRPSVFIPGNITTLRRIYESTRLALIIANYDTTTGVSVDQLGRQAVKKFDKDSRALLERIKRLESKLPASIISRPSLYNYRMPEEDLGGPAM